MINLVPETHTAPPKARRRYTWRAFALLAVFVAAMQVHDLSGGGQASALVVTILTAACLGAAVYELTVLMRALDELQQRVHLTALAIGCGATVMIVMMWGAASIMLGWPRFEALMAGLLGVFGYYIALFFTARRFS